MAMPLAFAPARELLRETSRVSEGGRLVIGAGTGSVSVNAGTRGAVHVEARWSAPLPFPGLEIERDGDDVYLEVLGAPALPWLPRWAWPPVHLEVSVPTRYSVQVTTCGGRIEICGVEGEVEARSRRGPLVFRDVRGPIDARTEGGSIDVRGCRGDVDVTAARGSIAIRDVLGRVSAHARAGRIAVVDAAGELLLCSSGGAIEIDAARAKELSVG